MPVLPGLQKNGGQAEQALGRSRGGFSTKIHVTVDGLGNPLRLHLTAGQRHDIIERHLIECFIGKIKHFRRVFSRFDKLARRYLGFVHLASALIWLR